MARVIRVENNTQMQNHVTLHILHPNIKIDIRDISKDRISKYSTSQTNLVCKRASFNLKQQNMYFYLSEQSVYRFTLRFRK